MTFPNATLGCLQCHTLFSEMLHFIVRNAIGFGQRSVAFQLLKCGIRGAGVWHSGCRSVAFQPGFCFGFFDEGGGVCDVHERVVSFQKAVLSGRGGAPSGMGQPR